MSLQTGYLGSNFRLPAIRHRIYQRIKRQYQSVCCTFDPPDTIPIISLTSSVNTISLQKIMAAFTIIPRQNNVTITGGLIHLYSSQFSESTISSHISAFSYVHKLLGLPDPSQMFIVKKLLRGCYKMGRSVDSRLPITRDILKKIINALPHILIWIIVLC